MEGDLSGEYCVYVVRIEPTVNGTWQVHVDGTLQQFTVPLQPLTLVVRVWRTHDTGVLRGTLRLRSTELVAPFQSNSALEQIIRSWLLGEEPSVPPVDPHAGS